MPSRTAGHILEDRSRARFIQAMPDEWVTRDVPHDYGIDLEVEIFREAMTTGLTFKVQLKATESIKGRARRAVKVEHLDYWRSLDVPVLIVLFVNKSDGILGKWSISHDPGPGGYLQKTTTVFFDEGDRLLAGRVSRLEAEVQQLRDLRAGRLERTIALRFSGGSDPQTIYHVIEESRLAIRERGLQEVLRVTTDASDIAFEVRLFPDWVQVAVPLNAGSLALHQLDANITSDSSAVAQIAICIAGAIIAQSGRTDDAVKVFASDSPSPAWFTPDVVARYVDAFAAESRVDLGLAAAEYLLGLEDLSLHPLVLMYLMPAIEAPKSLSTDSQELLSSMLEYLADAQEELEDQKGAAAVKLKSANMRTSLDEYGLALVALLQAVALDPSLGDQPSILGFVGGTAFRAGEYATSAEYYGKAALIDSTSTSGLSHLADALMWSGQFKRASEVLSGDAYGEPLKTPLDCVNRFTVNEIIARTGLESQNMRDLTEEEIERVESDPSIALSLLVEVKAMSVGLWYQLEPDPASWSAARSVLMCRLTLNDSVLWAIATIRAFHDNAIAEEDFEDIIWMAVNDGSSAYINEIEGMLSAGTIDAACADAIRNCTYRIATSMPTRGQGMSTFLAREGLASIPFS